MTDEVRVGLVLLLAVPALWALLWVGWRGRRRRQADVPELPAVPGDLGDAVHGPVEATYVGTTTAGDWLDRVAVRGLGVRSSAQVGVHAAGVLVARSGAPDVWVPAAAVVGARRERGMAGTFVEADGLVVLTWRLGTELLDTGFRVRHPTQREPLRAAVEGLTSSETTDEEATRG